MNEGAGRAGDRARLLRIAGVYYGLALILIAGLVFAGVAIHDNPARYFGEGRPGTTATVLAFVAAGIGSWLIRGDLKPRRFARFWGIAAAGFVYLALDDQFKIHENLDVAINTAFGLDPEHPVADKLDDAIVALYGPIALAIAWVFRRELLRLRGFLGFMGLGFVCFVAMVVLDATPWPEEISGWMLTGEESAKLLGAVSMMNGVFVARREAGSARRGTAG